MGSGSGEYLVWPYTDAIEVMIAHHLSLRTELGRLRAIDSDVQRRDPESLEDAALLARAAIDLFGSAGELHAFDEEALLFPRLREACGSGELAVVETLDRVEAEHAELRPLWPRLERYLTRLSADEPVSVRDLHESRLELEECVIAHMRFEELFVYPAARRVLGPDVLRDMMDEMRAHRRCPSVRPFAAIP